MKKFTVIFGIGLAGVVTCFVMTVITAIHEHQERAQPQVQPKIATPAY
jgi:hypothetical protein